MGKYAEHTKVPAAQSRAEIERILGRYGASAFMYGMMANMAVVAFEMKGRKVKMVLPFLDPGEREFTHNAQGKCRGSSATEDFYQRHIRQRWRALVLIIKAKLEAVESGITNFESEFLSDILMPDGITVGAHVKENIRAAYDGGNVPPLLEGPKEATDA